MRTVAELTLGREPDAVPRARRLVRSALAEDRPDLAADAELVISELVTNAVLHGEPPVTVRVLANSVVRLEVHDAGRSAPIMVQQGSDAMTGRGLSMVAAIASSWGVDPPESGGKVVWAELDPERSGSGRADPEVDFDALLEAWADEDPSTATYTVRLGPVSTELLLAAKSHIDNVVRELMLMREGEASSGVMLPAELSALIQTVTVDFAEARTEIKRQASASAARGEVLTDLELHLSPAAVEAGERYLEALDQADRYARSAHLLTLAPPRVHRTFRRWYVHTLVEQLRALGQGLQPPPPEPFQVVLATELSGLDDAAGSAERLAVLEKVSGELTRAVSPEEMARIAVDRSVEFLGVETARVRLLADGVLRTVAWRSRTARADHDVVDIPVDSDLPAALTVRRRQPIHIRSLAEAFRDIPELAGHYDSTLSGHASPLIADGEVIGAMTFTFSGGELSDEAEQAFVAAMGGVLANALLRARIVLDAARAANAGVVFDQMPIAALAVDGAGDIAACNDAAGRLLGREAQELIGQPLVSIMPARFRDAHRAAFAEFLSTGEGNLIGAAPFTVPALLADGSETDVEVTLTAAEGSGQHGVAAFATLRRSDDRPVGDSSRVLGRFLDASVAVLGGQKEVLERMVAGDPLPAVLDSLVEVVETAGGGGGIGSVLLLDDDGRHLRHGAAPRLPEAYVQAIDGIEIGPRVGSCGTAAYTRRQVVVEDIATDPLWEDFRELALGHGLRACWSTPIVAGDGQLLGTFAVYYREPRAPSADDQDLISLLVQTAAVAIGRARADQLRDAALADEQTARAELQKAHENLRFVLEATTRVTSSLDSDDTLRTLARIAVPALADICLIDLFDGLHFRRAATAAGETVDHEVAEGLNRFVADPTGDHPAATALRTGRAVFQESATDEALRKMGIHSWMAIPLAARGRALGAMTLLLVQPGRRYTESDIDMVEDLGRRVALAIDNTQLYESTREAERRLALVARAGVTLTSSLDLDTVAGRLCELITGEVADMCEVHIRRAPDQWWRYSPGSLLHRLVREERLPRLVAEAVESRSAVISRSAVLDAFADADPPLADAVTTVIPLTVHGEVVGVISVASPGADGPTRVPAETVDVIAGRAALAVDNALLYEQERTAAEILQRSLLPRHLPAMCGLRSAARYLPAGARNEVGGDWYDVIPLGPDRVGVVMGDVMGRGIPAASIMGQLRNGLRMLALQDVDPAEALQLLNRMLGTETESPLATVAYGVIDIPARTLLLANAGHLPPLLIRRSSSRYLDQKPGLPLGAFPDSAYTSITHELEAGDTLLMYTDGLIEQRDRGLEEGLDALLAVAGAVTSSDPDSICEVVLEAFRHDSDEDDTAALVLILD